MCSCRMTWPHRLRTGACSLGFLHMTCHCLPKSTRQKKKRKNSLITILIDSHSCLICYGTWLFTKLLKAFETLLFFCECIWNFTNFRSSWLISCEMSLRYLIMNWYDYFYFFPIAALPIQSLFPFLYFMVSNTPSTSTSVQRKKTRLISCTINSNVWHVYKYKLGTRLWNLVEAKLTPPMSLLFPFYCFMFSYCGSCKLSCASSIYKKGMHSWVFLIFFCCFYKITNGINIRNIHGHRAY
jgi:hypothetical protein